MRRALLFLAIAACSAPSKAPEAPPGNATEDDTIPVTACPGDVALVALAPRVWTRSTSFEHLWCVALRVGGEPRWYLAGYASAEDFDASPHAALVAPDGRVVWTEVDEYDAVYVQPHGDAEAHDLDGDGSDEVVYAETIGEGADAWSALVVVGFDGGATEIDQVALGDAGCEAAWMIEERTIVITGEGACASFDGRYRWDGLIFDDTE